MIIRNKKLVKTICVIVLLFTASFFRLYRIDVLTEFLGDQGRDGIVIHNLVKNKKLPVVGPSLSNGQFTGSFSSYLIAPSFIFSDNNPVIPAVQMAVIGVMSVLILFILSTSLFSFSVGYGISLLYALSPLMVFQDRRLWNPTTIPFFTLLVLLSMYFVTKKKYWALVFLFICDAILFQLHYVNSITIVLSLVFVAYELYKSIKNNTYKQFLLWVCIAFVISGALSFPFLSYESRIGFRDIVGSAGTFSNTDGFIFSKRQYLENIITIGSNLMKYIVVLSWKIPLFILSLCIIVINLLKRDTWSYVLVGWISLSVIILSFYKDTIHAQYLYQLIPITFLLVANTFEYIHRRLPRWVIYSLMIFLGAGMVYKTDVFGVGYNDISKTKEISETVMKLSVNEPFAFTTVSSRSFTDLHYRYFMDVKNITPEKIDSAGYTQLFIACDTGVCPTAEQLLEQNRIYAVCSEIVCGIDNPILDMSKWQKRDVVSIGSSVVYGFVRK